MRIFVGTLFTIENEFDECVESIKGQSYRNFQHFIFENLPNKEAHDALYSSFMNMSCEFDLLIKVDADMVIEDKNLFSKIVDKFENNAWLNELEIAVYDFFSDQLIWGLHVYRNKVKWDKNEERLFVDSSPVPSHQHLWDDKDLAPAAIHCKNPSLFQSFHYGVHRGLKILQPNRITKIRSHRKFHWNNLERTWQNFLNKGDIRLGQAVLGSELVLKRLLGLDNLDYSNQYASEIFKLYQNYDANKLRSKIQRMRITNWGFLPSKLRRKILCCHMD